MGDRDLVCVYEDDPAIQRLIAMILDQDEVDPLVCGSPEELVDTARTKAAGLAVVNVGMTPDKPLAVIRQLKAQTSTPVLVTSASGGEGIARACLEAGADDYLPKPFDPDELLDRVHFLLNRTQPSTDERGVFIGQSIQIDLQNRVLTVAGTQVPVSRTEWDILYTLTRSAPEPVFHADLARIAFDRELARDPEYLKLWIERLQAKLCADPKQGSALRVFHDIAYTLAVSELRA